MLRSLTGLDQTLRTVTPAHQRSVELERARVFFETLLRDREDIIADIRKSRPAFTHHRYVQLFTLMHASIEPSGSGDDDDEDDRHALYLARLAKAFSAYADH